MAITSHILYFAEGSATARLTLWGDGTATVSDLYSRDRRKGHATRLVAEICDYADQSGLSLLLEVANSEDMFALSQPALIKWYETFGFTVLEALSYGVPVMVTDSVGAKDIVCNISPELVLSGDKFGLKKLDLRSINRKIMNSETIIKTELAHEREILEVYEK